MITGQWQVTETAKTANNSLCQPPADPLSAPYSLWFTQSGGTVTALDASKNAFTSGTLNGSALSYTGSYPDGAGTTTLQPMAATIASTCNSATGTATWSYTEPGGFTCAGTTQFTATRTVGSGCSTVTTNSAATDTEPNDTPSTVQAVVRPVEITGSNAATETAASRTDLYSFTLAASTPVTIMLRRTSGITDIDLRLQTGAGVTMTSSASASGNEVISQTLAAGSYMVMVSTFGTVIGTTTYSLVIQ